MTKIEELDKILESYDSNSPISRGRIIREICQLFEPDNSWLAVHGLLKPQAKLSEPKPDEKISPYELPSAAVDKYFSPLDESGLLTDKEIENITRVTEDSGVPINEEAFYGISLFDLRALCKAQLAKDQQHEQGRMERIIKEIEKHGSPDFYTGNIQVTIKVMEKNDERDIGWWQALKKQEGVKV